MPFKLCCRKTVDNRMHVRNGESLELVVKESKEDNNKKSVPTKSIISSHIVIDNPNDVLLQNKKTKGEEDKTVILRDKFSKIIRDINSKPWDLGNSRDYGQVQFQMRELVKRYDEAMVQCGKAIGSVYRKTEEITPEIRKDIENIQDSAFEPLMRDIVLKGIGHLRENLDLVPKSDMCDIQKPMVYFTKGFLTSLGFGSKQFVYLLSHWLSQSVGGSAGTMALGIRSDLLAARIMDSVYIGWAHNGAMVLADQSVSKCKEQKDTFLKLPAPQGDHNRAMFLAQRMLGFDLPLAVCFWACYHVKGIVDTLTENTSPVGLATTGALASMTAGGLTALASSFSYKVMAVTQMRNLHQTLPPENGENVINKELLDYLKGEHYNVQKSGISDTSCIFGMTKAISSIVGSLLMLYYLNAQTVDLRQDGSSTGSPTMWPLDPTTMAPDESQPGLWSEDSAFVRTGLAMACYLIGWCLLRPILEVAWIYPSTDTKFNERIDKVENSLRRESNNKIKEEIKIETSDDGDNDEHNLYFNKDVVENIDNDVEHIDNYLENTPINVVRRSSISDQL